jgi:ribonuclease HII
VTRAAKPLGRAPRLVVEAALRGEGFPVVAGVDEVGRGCLSGPVTVGVVVVDPDGPRPPRGLRDSKLLTSDMRVALVPRIQRWVLASAVGHAGPEEVDAYGIIAALRLAGHRAVRALPDRPDCLLLDGNHDYLTPPAQLELAYRLPDDELLPAVPAVRTRIKADLTCASVAAASVLAKVTRDALMVELAEQHPGYGWDVNKGYATPFHRQALRRLGPSPLHRLTWRLGGEGADPDELAGELADELAAELADELADTELAGLAEGAAVGGRQDEVVVVPDARTGLRREVDA